MIALIRIVSLLACLPALSACVTAAKGSCELVQGVWTCEGAAGGTAR